MLWSHTYTKTSIDRLSPPPPPPRLLTERVKVPGKCLYFSTIGLGKQSIEKKKIVFQSNSPFPYLLCHFLIRIFDLCNSAPKVRVREYIFQPHIFCILLSEFLELLPCFLWISRKINSLNAKTFSYFSEWACIFRFNCLSVVETAKKLEKYECWVVKWSWRNESFEGKK